MINRNLERRLAMNLILNDGPLPLLMDGHFVKWFIKSKDFKSKYGENCAYWRERWKILIPQQVYKIEQRDSNDKAFVITCLSWEQCCQIIFEEKKSLSWVHV